MTTLAIEVSPYLPFLHRILQTHGLPLLHRVSQTHGLFQQFLQSLHFNMVH
jgi:hypothetical protein